MLENYLSLADNCHVVGTVVLFIFGHLSVSCRLLANVKLVKESPAFAHLSFRRYLLLSHYTFIFDRQQQQNDVYMCVRTQSISFDMSSDQVHKQWESDLNDQAKIWQVYGLRILVKYSSRGNRTTFDYLAPLELTVIGAFAKYTIRANVASTNHTKYVHSLCVQMHSFYCYKPGGVFIGTVI
jgi:hypothetical protein